TLFSHTYPSPPEIYTLSLHDALPISGFMPARFNAALLTHCPTETLRTFAGNACYLTHCPTEMLRALPGNALVIHADQIKAVSGRDRAALGPITRLEDALHIISGPASVASLAQRAHKRAHLIVQERTGR